MSTFEKFALGQNAASLTISNSRSTYSKVTMVISQDSEGNDRQVSVGDDSGSELIINAPNCNDTDAARTACRYILDTMHGFKYQPYTATGSLLDPSAEVGDGVTINAHYSGVYNRELTFGRLMASSMKAPQTEDVDHEYGGFEETQERKFKRITGKLYASLSINADAIAAEVQRASDAEGRLSSSITATANSITTEVNRATAAEGTLRSSIQQNATAITAKVSASGGSSSSFSWSLTSSGFSLISRNTTVMNVNSSGCSVRGTITATSGTIGGFTIGSSSIYNGITSLNDSSHTSGVYVGTNGINVGQNFKVTSNGSVSANNMTLSGTLNIGGTSISAANLRAGAARANSSGNNWDKGYTYGNDFNNACKDTNYTAVEQFYGKSIYATKGAYVATLTVNGAKCKWRYFTISGSMYRFLTEE